jgi:hypothetical protein
MSAPPNLPEHLCTMRAFADELGTSHQNVGLAIKSNKIHANALEVFEGKQYINRELARKQWARNWTGKGNSSASLLAKLRETSTDGDMDKEDLAKSKVERAKDASAVFDSLLKELRYKKEAGEVVDKQEVGNALFDLGRELRDKLLALPARTVPYIRAASSEHEAKKVLFDELHHLLEDLSNIENRLNQKVYGE